MPPSDPERASAAPDSAAPVTAAAEPAPAAMTSAGPPADDPPRQAAATADQRTAEPGGPAVVGRSRLVGGRMLTGLALVVLLLFLVAPERTAQLTPAALLRVPVDGLVGIALVLVLRERARRIAVPVVGLLLGVLAVLKVVSLGFSQFLDRPFNPAQDGSFLSAAVVYLRESAGAGLANTAAVLALALAVGLILLLSASFRRVSRLAVAHRTAAGRIVALLAVVWAVTVIAGVQLVPGLPVAAHDAYDRIEQVRAGAADRDAFLDELGTDAYAEVPGARLLTGLHGKDVVVAFVESYGRIALADPELSSVVDPVLAAGADRLRTAGYAALSGWLTSPTAGGGSWLAQSTFLSGLWIDSAPRYQAFLYSRRLTLSSAFGLAGWHTVSVMPATTQPWPEGRVYGYDRTYIRPDLNYQGPVYSFGTMPDQYTLSVFQRDQRGAGHPPVMGALALISSHSPWEPVPPLVGWDQVGDGSGYPAAAGSGDPAEIVTQRDRNRVRAAYRTAIAYSLQTLISYVERYGDDDLVLVFLGDHQPSPSVTGAEANRDVPITIVARDRAVLDRIGSWGWQDGLRPGPGAPVWRMDAFRDHFLTAFGPGRV
ncbi:sulfatase [Catellatospora sp. KI3]|uniref:sulfatase n=1 Tax=Catellatospora sp. KI3 TaxID=3041620 RepID=UPI00248306C7|nr:sulfatase [Catellatospora sp. KI3]MDI1462221.1 sulfatase [Catellatospora sp. KI3]